MLPDNGTRVAFWRGGLAKGKQDVFVIRASGLTTRSSRLRSARSAQRLSSVPLACRTVSNGLTAVNRKCEA